MDQHRDHPYPTEEEKDELRVLTGLKASQISNWLANTRRRAKTRTPLGASPNLRSPTWPIGPRATTEAIDIPFDKTNIRHDGKTWDIMNPLERWQHSPPENEPAPAAAIADAIASNHSPESSSASSSQSLRRDAGSSGGSKSSYNPFLMQLAPSVDSAETGQSGSLLSSESLSNMSLGSSRSHGSRNSFGSGPRKDRRRKRRTAALPGKLKPADNRPFQCTFCTDTFRTKYDWARHEKSLHLSLEKWICAPIGPVITISAGGQKQCVYCGHLDPNKEHTETHNHSLCEEKGMPARTFYRKDHLRQHLRLVHGSKMIPSMDAWKSEHSNIRCRCGFCGETFTQWQDRADHLAKHFKAGAQMSTWKGCRGLDPEVAAFVVNAMPPYLIGNEAKSPWPFSASDAASLVARVHHPGSDLEASLYQGVNWPLNADPYCLETVAGTVASTCPVKPDDDASGFVARMRASLIDCAPKSTQYEVNRHISTCWEIITVRLGQFVREQLQAGTVPSDETLQRQSRIILYGDDDSWDQTAADNPEWLGVFKRAHGLDGAGRPSMDPISFNEDLGLNMDDLSMGVDQFFVNNFCSEVEVTDFHTSMPTASALPTGAADIFASSMPTTMPMEGVTTALPPVTFESMLAAVMPTTSMG